MEEFAKLLKDVNNIKKRNEMSDKEISDLLARISIFYRDKRSSGQRERLFMNRRD
jgi:hypothetical protein